MCNDYGNYVDYADYLAAFSQTRIPVKCPDAIPNLQPRDDIWPTDKAPVEFKGGQVAEDQVKAHEGRQGLVLLHGLWRPRPRA